MHVLGSAICYSWLYSRLPFVDDLLVWRTRRSVWEVLDFGDVVVHLFTAEQREYYDLVRFAAAS